MHCGRSPLMVLLVFVWFAKLLSCSWPAVAKEFSFDTSVVSYGEPITANLQLWLPDDMDRVRGLIYLLPGRCGDWLDEAKQTHWQEAAQAIGFGIVGTRSEDYLTENNTGCFWGDPSSDEPTQILQRTLDAAAHVSSHPELSNVPIGLIGHSAGGLKSLILAIHIPSRVIAYSSLRGGAPPFDMSEETAHVPGLFIVGSRDSIVKPVEVQTGFVDYREQDAQVAFAVDWGAFHPTEGHFQRRVGSSWEMAWFWIAELVGLRYPEGRLPSLVPNQPLVLNTIDTDSGWLGDASAFEPGATIDIPITLSPFPKIGPIVSYKGEATTASWLPNEATANAYRAMTLVDPNRPIRDRTPGHFWDGPLEFTSPEPSTSPFRSHFVVNDAIAVTIDPHEFGGVDSIAEMRFFDGDRFIDTDTEGPDWGTTFKPDHAGIHALVVVASDNAGNQTSSFRTIVVQPMPVPEPSSILLGAFGLVGLLRIVCRRWDT